MDDTRLAHLAAIVDGSDDAIVSKDLRGIIQAWNPGAERIFGFTAQEAIGKPMTILFPRDRLSEEEVILAKIARGERIDHYETVRQRKDGTLLDISVTVSPIRDGGGRIVGASNIARDVTEKKRIEKELTAANERLRRLDEERRTFLNLVAHELRTPLTPIKMQLELLRDLLSSDTHRQRDLQRIERNMDRLTKLVEQILSLARLESGRLPLRLREVDLVGTVQETVDTFRESFTRARTAIDVSCPPTALAVVDEDRIAQILTNLLSNALKFSPPGGLIEISLALEGGTARLAVRDRGVGFDPKESHQLFQPFVRLDPSRPGTGLGLYISRAIARQHQGDLTAESRGRGRGAEFLLRLPTKGPTGPSDAVQRPPGRTVLLGSAAPPPPAPAAPHPVR